MKHIIGNGKMMPLYETVDEVVKLSYMECVEWLCWMDRNGCFRPEEQLREFGEINSLQHMQAHVLSMSSEDESISWETAMVIIEGYWGIHGFSEDLEIVVKVQVRTKGEVGLRDFSI